MPRFARVVLPGIPLHVVHRGNRRGHVFVDDRDRQSYLETLERYAERFALEVWAFCLMTNHVHLIACPRERRSIARTIAAVHRRHAVRMNARCGWTGHLWENRFYSTVLDERHLWCAVRYVERNPVRAGLVRRAELYPWSSAASHCGWAQARVLHPNRPFPGGVDRWPEWLADEIEDRNDVELLRRNSRTGRPTGSAQFIDQLERDLGRKLPGGTGTK